MRRKCPWRKGLQGATQGVNLGMDPRGAGRHPGRSKGFPFGFSLLISETPASGWRAGWECGAKHEMPVPRERAVLRTAAKRCQAGLGIGGRSDRVPGALWVGGRGGCGGLASREERRKRSDSFGFVRIRSDSFHPEGCVME